MKKTIKVLLLVIAFFSNGCKKNLFTNSEDKLQIEHFFNRITPSNSNLSIETNSTNNNASLTNAPDILDSVIQSLKIEEDKLKFVTRIVKRLGYPQWEYSLALNNENGLKTIFTPIIDSNQKVNSLILSYQITKNKFLYKVIERNQTQDRLPLLGDKAGKSFTKYTLLGIFGVLEKSFNEKKVLIGKNKSTITKKATSFSTEIKWECWYYVSYSDLTFLITNTQCTFSIIITKPAVAEILWDESLMSGGGGFSGSGNTVVNPYTTLYDCNCTCENSLDIDSYYAESYEPKWGQLGTLDNIITEINRHVSITPNFPSNNLETQLNSLRDYFNANRMFTRDNDGNLVDDFLNGSKKRDRYLYTFDLGWIDLHHFFYAAYLAEKYNVVASNSFTSYGELFQFLKGNESAFSYEDLPSNAAGIDFYKKYAGALRNKTIDINVAVKSFFQNQNAADPADAPNYAYIPHILDQFYAKNISIKGLTGTTLQIASFEAFCKKPISTKEKIKDAHLKIKRSSND